MPDKKQQSQIMQILAQIPDPEIPVLTILDLGIVRDVLVKNNKVIITITPTYSGCPAMNQIEDDIILKLKENGFTNVQVKTTYDPPWTTDWISEEALKKLEEYGIAPPVKGTQDKGVLFTEKVKLVRCPQCKSLNTSLISQFGSTACKALYKCNDCLEPFDYFKCI